MRPGITLFVLGLLVCAPAYADDWNLFTPCRDAGMSEREVAFREHAGQCDQRELAKVHSDFGVPPIAELVGADGQAVRVTITDGYGHRVVVAEAVRRAGAAGALAIARGRGDGERRPPQSMQADLERDAWDAIARRAVEQARAQAVPPLPAWRDGQGDDDNEPIIICLHGWSVMIETLGFGQPRVIHRNSCDDRADGTYDFGWRSMRYVFAAFHQCGWLDQQFFRNDAARLSFCLGLSGEVAIAAAATNALHPFMYDALASPRLRYLLADDFTLTLEGEAAVAGADAAFSRWRDFTAAGEYELGFDTATGAEDNEWRQSAQLSVLLFDEAYSNANRTRFAEVRQAWRRQDEFWLLHSMQVGPWQAITFADDD